MIAYFDTSALVKRYVQEADSDQVLKAARAEGLSTIPEERPGC